MVRCKPVHNSNPPAKICKSSKTKVPRHHTEKMSFHPRFANGDFSPLLVLLDEFDAQRPDRSNQGTNESDSRPQTSKNFSPRFDMREMNDVYLLDGEIPGVGQSDVEIEFTDANTLAIKGHGRRDYENGKSVTLAVDSGEQATSSKSHQPTAEDEAGGSSIVKVSPKGVLKKYLVSERQVGQFERTFTFSAKVEQDGVKASLKNGILSIVVPKTVHTTKKITIE